MCCLATNKKGGVSFLVPKEVFAAVTASGAAPASPTAKVLTGMVSHVEIFPRDGAPAPLGDGEDCLMRKQLGLDADGAVLSTCHAKTTKSDSPRWRFERAEARKKMSRRKKMRQDAPATEEEERRAALYIQRADHSRARELLPEDMLADIEAMRGQSLMYRPAGTADEATKGRGEEALEPPAEALEPPTSASTTGVEL